jgi:hypothetical protein
MTTVGFMMSNFSVLTTTKMANLKQAQLTSKSMAQAMVDYFVGDPTRINAYGANEVSSWQSIEGMGDFRISISKSNTDQVDILCELDIPLRNHRSESIALAKSAVSIAKLQETGIRSVVLFM